MTGGLLTSEETEREAGERSVRDFISRVCATDLSPLRIAKLSYVFEGKRQTAAAGSPHPMTGRPVVAILLDEPQRMYYICTRRPGMQYDGPTLVGAWNVEHVELVDGTGARGETPPSSR